MQKHAAELVERNLVSLNIDTFRAPMRLELPPALQPLPTLTHGFVPCCPRPSTSCAAVPDVAEMGLGGINSWRSIVEVAVPSQQPSHAATHTLAQGDSLGMVSREDAAGLWNCRLKLPTAFLTI